MVRIYRTWVGTLDLYLNDLDLDPGGGYGVSKILTDTDNGRMSKTGSMQFKNSPENGETDTTKT